MIAQPWGHALAAYRGAPMGKADTWPDDHFTGRVLCRRVPINRQGYGTDGTYWGLGGPGRALWNVHTTCGALDVRVRAESREAATRRALAMTPCVRVSK